MQGVYKIEDPETHKLYIGSSKYIEKRWQTHRKKLKENKHHSYKLQNRYNESILDFIYEIIEEVEDENKLFEREQFWLDFYDSYRKGYNCSPYADAQKDYTARMAEKRFKEFINLYNKYKNRISFGKKLEERLMSLHYQAKTYLDIMKIINFFINEYDEYHKLVINCRNRDGRHNISIYNDKGKNISIKNM